MPPSKNAIRKQYTLAAAHATVDILKQHNLQCVFIGAMAEYLHGKGRVPLKVELAVFPDLSSSNPIKQPPNVIDLLCESSTNFVRKGKRALAYHDRSSPITIPEGQRDWCDLHIITLAKAPMHYHQSHINQRQGLPTLAVLALTANHVHTMLQRKAHSERSQNPWPGQKDLRQLDEMLKMMIQPVPQALDEKFNLDAKTDFESFAAALPEYAARLEPLIRLCSGSLNDIVPPIEAATTAARTQLSSSTQPAAEDVLAASAAGASSRLSPGRRKRASRDQPAVPGQSQGQASAPTPTPTQMLFDITREVVQILKDAGIASALFGSLGTSLYGNQRSPNDIDLLTFPPPDQDSDPERIKQLIVSANPYKFYLRDSVNPSATYKILFYRLTRRQNPTRFFRRNSCKVDILVPGIMHFPSLHLNPERVVWIDGLPVLPFAVLMIQKLQAWDDHRNMNEETEPQKYAKRFVDKNDLGRMFKMEEHVRPLREAAARPWKDRILFSEEFEALSWRRARDFVRLFPEFKTRFLSIGLGEDTYDLFA